MTPFSHVRMEFSRDRHNTLFHIDDSLDHISELLLCLLVQLVPGHGIPNYFDFHRPRPTNSRQVSPHWEESICLWEELGISNCLAIEHFW